MVCTDWAAHTNGGPAFALGLFSQLPFPEYMERNKL